MENPHIPELPEIEGPEARPGNTLWRSGKLGLLLAVVFGYYELPFLSIVIPVLLETGAEYMRFRFSRNTEPGWAIILLLLTSVLYSAGLFAVGRLLGHFWPAG